MKSSKESSTAFNSLMTLTKILSDPHGTVLVYVVVLILIFGVLGVSLVSMFTTATTSSALPNSAKRARYMAESGVRYAFSELRDSNFASDTINDLNSINYQIGNKGEFKVNVVGYWFKSPADYNTNSSVILDIGMGKYRMVFLLSKQICTL